MPVETEFGSAQAANMDNTSTVDMLSAGRSAMRWARRLYIADMARVLSRLAAGDGEVTLAYLLSMVEQEALDGRDRDDREADRRS